MLNQYLLHVIDLVIQDLLVLAFRDTITEVVDVLRTTTATNLDHPSFEEVNEHAFNIGFREQLNTNAVGLASSCIPACMLVPRHGNSSHGSLRTANAGVRDVGA